MFAASLNDSAIARGASCVQQGFRRGLSASVWLGNTGK